jgi:membrane protein implicated in regulation of membrane protease activity
MDIQWWHWLVLGLLLALAEMVSAGGFFIIFFGLGALIVGVLKGAGVIDSTAAELLLFAAVSVALLVAFRNRLKRWLNIDREPTVDALVGDIGVIEHDLAPDDIGKLELRGSQWSARNASTGVLRAGSRCRVLRVDGLLLYIGPEGNR